MTIMFAGGMTIAIPGELPVAVAQTTSGTLSVSATGSFGGPQILEIVVDDPSRNAVDAAVGQPDVSIDDSKVVMAQANTGKWYAYVASNELNTAVGEELGLGPSIETASAPAGYDRSGAAYFFESAGTSPDITGAGTFLSAETLTPLTGNVGQIIAEVTDWPVIQVYSFTDDSSVDITYDSETITLKYAKDLDDDASVSADRTGVPASAQMHVTISDVQLNLNPTKEDVWHLTANGNASYNAIDTFDWQGSFEGDTAEFKISDMDSISISYDDPSTSTIMFEETGSNTGVFVSYNSTDDSKITINEDARPNSKFTIDYAGSELDIIVEDYSSSFELVRGDIGNTFDSAETLGVKLTAPNLDTNTLTTEDITIGSPDIPVMTLGEPITLKTATITPPEYTDYPDVGLTADDDHVGTLTIVGPNIPNTFTITLEADQIERLQNTNLGHYIFYDSPDGLVTTTNADIVADVLNPDAIPVTDGLTLMTLLAESRDTFGTFELAFTMSVGDGTNENATNNKAIADAVARAQTEAARIAVGAVEDDPDTDVDETAEATLAPTAASVKSAALGTPPDNLPNDNPAFSGDDANGIDSIDASADDTDEVSEVLAEVERVAEASYVPETMNSFKIIADILTFGNTENHAIYRALLEESDTESGVFEGTIEYLMLNQINYDDERTHSEVATFDDELVIILNEDSTLELEYDDTHLQVDATTHTGEVSLDADTYRTAETVTVTLVDPDLNIDGDSVDVYTTDADGTGMIGPEDRELLTIEIDGIAWSNPCGDENLDTLVSENFALREDGTSSGTFTGTFSVPENHCDNDSSVSTTGKSITATYIDFRDESSKQSQASDSATIRAHTGSVSLDRTVYPVPAGIGAKIIDADATAVVYVSVEDADFDSDSDSINSIDSTPVNVTINGKTVAHLGTTDNPLEETSTDSGIFEATVDIIAIMTNLDAKPDNNEPDTIAVEQGSIITVSYDDPTDASGSPTTVSDSATFDLRNAVLQSDKSTYVIGQDALLTLIEPDRNLDSDSVETVALARIAWDSDAYDGDLNAPDARANLGPVPSNLRETGLNTGIFQVVITISEDIGGDALERGEDITLTYVDQGPSGADTVGDDDRDVELFIKTSNFGATLELDQNVYTWTDKVFITVVASDYNFDSNVIDEIGTTEKGEINIRTRSGDLEGYKLAETGSDTGVFTGEITLIGTEYKADPNINVQDRDSDGSGPTGGILQANNEDGLSVSFEYSDGEAPLVASALIRWNVGEVQWLEASYSATGSGIARVIDPDMNINPDAVDNLEIIVFSETFLGGIVLTVTETQESSGIFEGTVEFDPTAASQGHRLQVTEGDIVTAEYDDYTLPSPDGKGDNLPITATALIGSIVPPLERAPASNPAIVDAFGNALASVSVDQQVQITADLTSGQDRDQDFAYLVQIQNEDGVTIALSWITGTLGAGATFSPSQSWTPDATGSYTATIFVWESVSNPTALSPQLSITIDVV